MKKQSSAPNQLPQLEVGEPLQKKVFGVTQTTAQYPIEIHDADGKGGFSITTIATARGKTTADLLIQGVEAAKLLQKFAANPAICKSVANQNVKLKAEMHRIIDGLAELGFAAPNESYVPKENRDIKIE